MPVFPAHPMDSEKGLWTGDEMKAHLSISETSPLEKQLTSFLLSVGLSLPAPRGGCHPGSGLMGGGELTRCLLRMPSV